VHAGEGAGDGAMLAAPPPSLALGCARLAAVLGEKRESGEERNEDRESRGANELGFSREGARRPF